MAEQRLPTNDVPPTRRRGRPKSYSRNAKLKRICQQTHITAKERKRQQNLYTITSEVEEQSQVDPRGMLIDLDLAKESDDGPSGVRHRARTMEFMAIQVLKYIIRNLFSVLLLSLQIFQALLIFSNTFDSFKHL